MEQSRKRVVLQEEKKEEERRQGQCRKSAGGVRRCFKN